MWASPGHTENNEGLMAHEVGISSPITHHTLPTGHNLLLSVPTASCSPGAQTSPTLHRNFQRND